jgi:hypothetical protein
MHVKTKTGSGAPDRIRRIASGVAVVGILAFGASGCATRMSTELPDATDQLSHVAADSENQLLNVSVQSTQPAFEDAGIVAARVRAAVEGGLAGQVTLSPDNPDIIVALTVTTEEFDRSGEFSLYQGEVQAVATRVFDNKILGRNTFTGKGKRELGADEALRSVSGVLAKDTSEWVAKTLAPAVQGLCAVDIRTQAPWYRSKVRQAEYATRFVTEAGRLDGIVSCVLKQQDPGAGTMVFRVVYFKDRFPEGLINRLMQIKTLNLEPR